MAVWLTLSKASGSRYSVWLGIVECGLVAQKWIAKAKLVEGRESSGWYGNGRIKMISGLVNQWADFSLGKMLHAVGLALKHSENTFFSWFCLVSFPYFPSLTIKIHHLIFLFQSSICHSLESLDHSKLFTVVV
ncbi:hypothetical protein Salat_0500700 [Sesamum alatum]|uniref:Uncharacterized protein n=1 Tax=Sesamum alatum TaxID=300844 RepID=A0AAE1Z578_9LAMI|nr:hypothetical protein Salat_0500700 [Sesamum alatum]